ncbi:MAG: hypothetical protein K0R33_3049, partial [Mycobacterium sp.]|nr:hypothetical protein [Mycobacterium sp.]
MEARRYVGKWWLPGKAEQAVGGVLEIDPQSSRLRLELTDELVEDRGESPEMPDLIHGAAEGQHITLIEPGVANGGAITMAQAITITQVLRPQVALIGVHLDQVDQPVFDGMRA